MATLHQFDLIGSTASVSRVKWIKLIKLPIISDDYEKNSNLIWNFGQNNWIKSINGNLASIFNRSSESIGIIWQHCINSESEINQINWNAHHFWWLWTESNRLMATLHQFSIDPLNKFELIGNTASISLKCLSFLMIMAIHWINSNYLATLHRFRERNESIS